LRLVALPDCLTKPDQASIWRDGQYALVVHRLADELEPFTDVHFAIDARCAGLWEPTDRPEESGAATAVIRVGQPGP
jgi:hypothetical protein